MTAGANAIIPIIGGLALIVGGVMALVVDRLDVIANGGPQPVYLRYTSLATYDLKKRPHWIFLIATAIFAPCIIVTAMWQAEVFPESEQNNDKILRFGIASGVFTFLVALFPMGNLLGSIVHMLMAGAAASSGINYGVACSVLASDMGNNGLETIRFVFLILGGIGAFGCCCVTFPAVAGTSRLQRHEAAQVHLSTSTTTGTGGTNDVLVPEELPPTENHQEKNDGADPEENQNNNPTDSTPYDYQKDVLEQDKIVECRRLEVLLAMSQIFVAITIGVILLTAAVEVVDVEDAGGDDMNVLFGGLMSFAGIVVAFSFFFFTNDWFYNVCQANSTFTT